MPSIHASRDPEVPFGRGGNTAGPPVGGSRCLAKLASVVVAGSLAGGCAALLPTGEVHVQSTWKSFDGAREAIERVVPYTTGRSDLKALGFDPLENRNVVILNYSDILRRFVPGAPGQSISADPGVSDCLNAPSQCTGLEVSVGSERSDRNGNFLLDFFNFHRIAEITGWRFNAIILLKGNQVVYRTWGGEPHMLRTERTVNPLGPFQGLGGSPAAEVPSPAP